MFGKKKICTKCKIGKESYELDKLSHICPYIVCWKHGKCKYFLPLEKPSKTSFFKKLKNYIWLK